MTEHLKPGDKIWVRGPFGTRHYGIYIGWYELQRGLFEHCVVHNSKVQHGVVIDSLARFVGGQLFFIESRAAEGYEQAVVDRALALYGSKYDLLGVNCEHMVNMAQSGEHKSQQLRNATGLALFAGLAALMVSSGDRPRYDRSVERYRDRRGRFASR